jgi:hypothetical protein
LCGDMWNQNKFKKHIKRENFSRQGFAHFRVKRVGACSDLASDNFRKVAANVREYAREYTANCRHNHGGALRSEAASSISAMTYTKPFPDILATSCMPCHVCEFFRTIFAKFMNLAID